MLARYLLDTNTVSYIIKGNIPRVRERLVQAPMAQVAISVITEAELLFGIARRPEAERLKVAVEEFLLRVEVLPWDSKAARHYANVRATLERAGTSMGNLDLMIAAHTLAAEAVLVTNDRAFGRVKQLKTEDWTKPR
jgi:tRNA(fMet)-specific endonuclease VapC